MNNKVKVVSLGVFLLIIFFIPTSIWNYNQLDNFIFQNIFTTMPIEAIESLQEYRENFNYIYPFNLIFPNSISAISSILGFQFLILFIIFKNKKETNILLFITISTIILHYYLSMNEARIYYEFILWLAVGIYFIDDSKINYNFFSKIITIQLIAVLCMTLYFAVISFPAIFSIEYRDKFMIKNSFGYDAIKWVNKTVPQNAKIISGLRSHALFQNEFVPTDWLSFGISKSELSGFENIVIKKKINYIVLRENTKYITQMKDCIGNKVLESPEFITNTRNPFNRGYKYKVLIFEFNSNNIKKCVK